MLGEEVGHFRNNFAEILFNPVAFDLHSFDRSENTCEGVIFSNMKSSSE